MNSFGRWINGPFFRLRCLGQLRFTPRYIEHISNNFSEYKV